MATTTDVNLALKSKGKVFVVANESELGFWNGETDFINHRDFGVVQFDENGRHTVDSTFWAERPILDLEGKEPATVWVAKGGFEDTNIEIRQHAGAPAPNIALDARTLGEAPALDPEHPFSVSFNSMKQNTGELTYDVKMRGVNGEDKGTFTITRNFGSRSAAEAFLNANPPQPLIGNISVVDNNPGTAADKAILFQSAGGLLTSAHLNQSLKLFNAGKGDEKEIIPETPLNIQLPSDFSYTAGVSPNFAGTLMSKGFSDTLLALKTAAPATPAKPLTPEEITASKDRFQEFVRANGGDFDATLAKLAKVGPARVAGLDAQRFGDKDYSVLAGLMDDYARLHSADTTLKRADDVIAQRKNLLPAGYSFDGENVYGADGKVVQDERYAPLQEQALAYAKALHGGHLPAGLEAKLTDNKPGKETNKYLLAALEKSGDTALLEAFKKDGPDALLTAENSKKFGELIAANSDVMKDAIKHGTSLATIDKQEKRHKAATLAHHENKPTPESLKVVDNKDLSAAKAAFDGLDFIKKSPKIETSAAPYNLGDLAVKAGLTHGSLQDVDQLTFNATGTKAKERTNHLS